MIAGADGEQLWYQPGPGGIVEGVSFTEDGTVLMLTATTVLEVDLMGRERLRVARGPGDDALHHDVFKRAGHVYALTRSTVTVGGADYSLDGVDVFDAAGGRVAQWRLADVFLPPAGDPDLDYSHANSVFVSEDLTLFVGFRHMSTAVALVGDPAAPDFGAVEWVMEGDPDDAAWRSDVALTSSIGAEPTLKQFHHFQRLPDGRYRAFDNRVAFTDPSRVVTLTIDPALGVADVVGSAELPVHCSFQGGASTVGDHTLGTCAPLRTAWEHDANGVEVGTFRADCAAGVSLYVPRFDAIAP